MDCQLTLEHADNITYIGICLDTQFGELDWVAISGKTEEEVKQLMVDEGYNLDKSFILKVTLPSTKGMQRDKEQIQVINANPMLNA